ncbi:MAG TPA: efflux RND transporter permease subunit [Terriglobia bacterium]|nr:efflux RND transporter permease subunit [Terriglobia bacterium]
MKSGKLGVAGRIAHFFINSKLTPLLMIFALLLGVFAVLETPREEDPQIVVPMMDVFIQMPGSTAQETEKRVTTPEEKLIWEIPGVQYVYSTTRPGLSLVIVRFKVGENQEQSIVKLYSKLYSHFDAIPPGASKPLIKPRSIDDVPALALTFWSNRYDSYTLRRVAAEVEHQIQSINDVSITHFTGGEQRQIRVVFDPRKMAARGLAPAAIVPALQQSNQRLQSGAFASNNQESRVETGTFLHSAEDVGSVVVGVNSGHPVYLRDIATIQDGPAEPSDYVLFGLGRGSSERVASPIGDFPAVTLSVSKRKGTNAVAIVNRVLTKVDGLKGTVIPSGVHVTITRNYGATAQEKSNELLEHLLIATLAVTALIALALGWRSSMVVLAAVPVTLALTLFIYFMDGYTLNRVTLFALIFSIGILVDDAIVVVENITRHFHLPENKNRPLADVAVEAVDAVGNPTALATLAVIAAILPMAFVGGLMGPYMRPIPVGGSVAMVFSLFIALALSPWAAIRMLAKAGQNPREAEEPPEGWTVRIYRRLVTPLILNARKRRLFLAGVIFLLLAALSLPLLKIVWVKMLPFDNKSEFQIIVDMPEGTTLEQTARVTREVAQRAAREPEVANYVVYAGTAGPYNFNGLVRHYFLRRGANQADVQVNLLPKQRRSSQSHEIAKRVRLAIDPIGARYGAKLKVAEIPPGPPVYATLMAEIFGPSDAQQIAAARQVREIFRRTPGVVDVDWSVEAPEKEFRFVVDKQKAALNGISDDQIAQTLRLGLSGAVAGLAHLPDEREDVDIFLRLPRADRSTVTSLGELRVMSPGGTLVPLSELTRIDDGTIEKSIYHENLKRVVYVTGDVAGQQESPIYAMLKMGKALNSLRAASGKSIERYWTAYPFFTNRIAFKWDGEWRITYHVFRDLGFAFAVALILIYVIVVAWFQSFRVPLVIMAPIPLTLIGILPAHALMGAFFTATSIIGFIAGAGIIVRNSIIVVDFADLRMQQGLSAEQAVIEAGAVRFRPILLTAAAVVAGSFVIIFDPIFQGLAISLMAGAIASTLLSQLAIPVLYFYHARRLRKKPQDLARSTPGESTTINPKEE